MMGVLQVASICVPLPIVREVEAAVQWSMQCASDLPAGGDTQCRRLNGAGAT